MGGLLILIGNIFSVIMWADQKNVYVLVVIYCFLFIVFCFQLFISLRILDASVNPIDSVDFSNNDSLTQENINSIRSNYSTYSKLELIAKQIQFLKLEAENILKNHDLNNDLTCLKYNFRN